MLLTGKEKLERLRDGRRIYLGKEKIDDVTTHPAFKGAAHEVAKMYDAKADPANRDLMSFAENGERYSMYYLRAKTREDLARRTPATRRWPISPTGSSAARPTTSPA